MVILINTFSALLIACSTLVIQSPNPIYSVLFLILAFFNASALVLLAGHDYMCALLIVLYVGAMCTFFLFAIMILDIKVAPRTEKVLKLLPINAIVAIVFAIVGYNILSHYHSPIVLSQLIEPIPTPLFSHLLDYTTQIYSLGSVLYTTYALHLILASLILLSAMLGTIALTLDKSSSSSAKGQQTYEQIIRDYRSSVAKYR